MSKPSQGHTNWVPDNDPNKSVNPGNTKAAAGWQINEKPAFQFMNFLFATLDQWDEYFETTTDTQAAQISTLQTTVASQGTAAGVSASHSGHTVLTGSTVQAQLDEADQAFADLYNAITSGKGIDLVGYDPSSPGNWNATVPANGGAALDQLASRMRTVEAATGGANYDDKTFYDYFLPAESPNGAGNTGLTDNANVNPRGLKFADGQFLYGVERIYIREIQLTGNYDANGLQEWAPVSPSMDKRVRLYGTWEYFSNYANSYCYSASAGDYVLISGVFDGAAVLAPFNATGADLIEVWVDGVDTGTQVNQRSSYVTLQDSLCKSLKFSNNQMIGLTQNIHTIKLVNAASDSNTQMQVSGISLVNTTPLDLASTFYLEKVETALAQSVPTLATATNNGGVACKYIDRADGQRKETVSNSYAFNTSVTGSLSIGATAFTVNSASGLSNNDLLLIQDGPGNSEIVLANSVNTLSGSITIAGSGTKNAYTDPTVSFYGKVSNAVNHSNEQKGRSRMWNTMGASSNAGIAMPVQLGLGYGTTVDCGVMEDGGTRLAGVNLYNRDNAWAANRPNYNSLNFAGNGDSLIYEGVFTGLDVFIDSGTNGTNAGNISIAVDGVLVITNMSIAAYKNFNLKICSDLPLCHHIVQIIDTSSGGFQYGFLQFQEFMPKQTSIELALAKGDLIAHRNIVASYVWDNYNNPTTNVFAGSSQMLFQISKGVVRHHWQTDAIFTGSGWVGAQSINNFSAGLNVASANTGDKITKSFFGTGIDLRFQTAAAYGKAQIAIDGVNVTSSNFPSATLQGLGFSSSTGILDMYNTTTYESCLSLANLSATPQFHTITMTITGTKNSSSSNYECNVSCFDVHGAVQYADATGGMRPMHSQILGGVKDERTMSYNGFDTKGRLQGFTALAMTSTYGVGTGDILTPDGFCGDIYMPEDGILEMAGSCTMRTTGAGDIEIGFVVDGMTQLGSASQNFFQSGGFVIANIQFSQPLKKGWHQISCQIGYSGSGSCYAYGDYRFFEAYVRPQQRVI